MLTTAYVILRFNGNIETVGLQPSYLNLIAESVSNIHYSNTLYTQTQYTS